MHGFKIGAAFDPSVEIPLAVKIDTIEEPDDLHELSVIRQAKKNLGEHAEIKSLVSARGFLDGKLLYELDAVEGLELVIPSKEKMDVTEDVRSTENMIIVFVENKYGIFWTHKAFILAGVNIRGEMEELNLSRAELLEKFMDSH